jgi:2-polyprenyl-3-methyl-5-hydroxy-6-metoxy-1,4-benzoquinol methylase
MTDCIVCHSPNKIRKIYDHHSESYLLYAFKKILGCKYTTSGAFNGVVHVCVRCGHGVLSVPPAEDEIEAYYKKQYWTTRPTIPQQTKEQSDAFKNDLRARFQTDFVLNHIKLDAGSDVLEIGAGAAYASLLLRERSNGLLSLNVCEPGENWVGYYNQNDIKRLSSYFPFQGDQKFDYIHTSHWLEHVVNLHSTVERLAKITKSNGFVFIEVPNTESFYWSLPLLDTPHIHFFTRASLSRVFERHNFHCIEIGTFGQTFFEKFKGKPMLTADYGPAEKGCWIRALFKRKQ